MWDQIALERYGDEAQMAALLPANTDEADALIFSGGVSLDVPEAQSRATRSVPPWERME